MKYINRALKGTYGYIRKQTVFETVKTIVMFVMAFGLFFIGYYTLHTKKSLWSILAVLALLPASRSLVGLIMLLRFRSLSNDSYLRYKEAISVPVLYENILTTASRSFYLPVICFAKGVVTAYADIAPSDVNEISSHLTTVLKNAGHNTVVKVFADESAFLKRAGELDLAGYDPGPVINTIKAVSL